MLVSTSATEESVFLVCGVHSSALQNSDGSGMLKARNTFPVEEQCSSTKVALRVGNQLQYLARFSKDWNVVFVYWSSVHIWIMAIYMNVLIDDLLICGHSC